MCQLLLARLSMIDRLPVCALQGQQLQKQPLLFSPVRCKYLNKTSFLEENVRVATSSVVGCMVGAFWGFQGEKFLCFRLFLLTWDNLGKTPGEWHRWRASAQEMSCLHCQDPRMPEIDWDRLRMIEKVFFSSHQTPSLVEKAEVGEPRLKPARHPRTPHSA